jgi:ribosome-binding protein aMBF1 (putative translation factor)
MGRKKSSKRQTTRRPRSGKWDAGLHASNASIANSVGAAIRVLRLERALSQVALADKAGVAADLIVKVEAGRGRWPSLSSLVAIASALDVRLDTLVKAATAAALGERPA